MSAQLTETHFINLATLELEPVADSPDVLAALEQAATYARQAAEAREMARTSGDRATMLSVAATLDGLARRQRERAEWLRSRRLETRDGAPVFVTPPADSARAERGRELAASGAVRALSSTWFEVTGSEGHLYLVVSERGAATCTCPDHQRRGHTCKHIVACGLAASVAA